MRYSQFGEGKTPLLRCIFIVSIIGITISFPILGIAAEVNIQQAKIVAQNWLYQYIQDHKMWAGSTYPQIIGEETLKYNTLAVGYNFLIAPRGHIIVPVRDELPPIKLYSETVTLSIQSPDNNREVLTWLIEDELLQPVQAFTQQTAQTDTVDWSSTTNGRLWQIFSKSRQDFSPAYQQYQTGRQMIDLEPLLTTKWSQGDPYNLFTPLWSDGEKTVTGCVATSAAQILNYWKYPSKGQGSTSYSWWNGQKSISLSREFSQSTYDWNNMANTYDLTNTQAQKEAVAKLMADVGIAWHMNYGRSKNGGSGAYTLDGVTIYPKYFKYKNTLKSVARTSYNSDSAWMQVFKNEVLAGRPSHFAMRDWSEGAGHAVVVDGYRDSPEEQIHINLGWGGSYDAWYATDNIETGKYFWNEQSAIIGIEPDRVCELGDLNCDGMFNEVDIKLELSCMFENGICARADLNNDSIYDVFDIQLLVRKIAP